MQMCLSLAPNEQQQKTSLLFICPFFSGKTITLVHLALFVFVVHLLTSAVAYAVDPCIFLVASAVSKEAHDYLATTIGVETRAFVLIDVRAPLTAGLVNCLSLLIFVSYGGITLIVWRISAKLRTAAVHNAELLAVNRHVRRIMFLQVTMAAAKSGHLSIQKSFQLLSPLITIALPTAITIAASFARIDMYYFSAFNASFGVWNSTLRP